MIQSVLFEKSKFTKQKAIAWIKRHMLIPNTSAPNFGTTSYWRFRQFDPSKKYQYRTKKITEGIYIVLAYK